GSFSEPPANTTLPAISGISEPGHTLTTSNGTWSGSTPMSFGYQWLRDGTPIAGETGSSYVVLDTDRGHALSAQVTATNLGGSASATSAAVSVPQNDDFANAIVLGGLSGGTVTGTTDGATGEPGEPVH